LEERDHLGDPIVDGRIILKLIFRKWDRSMDWTNLAQDRDRWDAFVKAEINQSGFIKCTKFLENLRTGYLLK
jgi:hypothetical protein